ncbi:uncharacterized protein TRAVEDRAFT_44606 [Trametes versicolor FP-101664 SS1]|uniref:uncharacterized protein n=1 Tax=Trametes versicolor (strain FP-101664) TaxID=717944 RepID=UPI0004622917|nr:uncharacterized protein TRAVEDRAFT_44606 [Trametes versicolor FP-101664 SS1]EIW61785.1 hypothetical protein TRAVEDRAFT_44606 [Trametes versicolor FP-101664 SS1]
MSVIGDHAAKKLEKLMAKEAKAEEQNIKHALKDVKKAEKAVKKSVKAVEKAEKKKQKVLKTEHSTVKALTKAKHKHADVLEGEAKAEAAAAAQREKEVEADRGVQQTRAELESMQMTLGGNAKERESRLAEVLGHFGEGDAVVPTSAQLASRL